MERVAEHCGSQGLILIPASAYAEMLVRPLRAGTADRFDAFVDRREVELVPVDRALAHVAAQLGAAHPSLRPADALVLATAHAREAELLTFDDRLRRIADTYLA